MLSSPFAENGGYYGKCGGDISARARKFSTLSTVFGVSNRKTVENSVE